MAVWKSASVVLVSILMVSADVIIACILGWMIFSRESIWSICVVGYIMMILIGLTIYIILEVSKPISEIGDEPGEE